MAFDTLPSEQFSLFKKKIIKIEGKKLRKLNHSYGKYHIPLHQKFL